MTRIFAFPRVIEDLLRAFVPGDWLQEVSFATLRKLSTEYISDELLKRHGDNVWRMRLRKNWLYLLLLVEFQSTDDPLMALRIHTYTGFLYQELARNGQLDADGRLPAVLPLVLYNGDEPWESPLQMGELIAPVGPSRFTRAAHAPPAAPARLVRCAPHPWLPLLQGRTCPTRGRPVTAHGRDPSRAHSPS